MKSIPVAVPSAGKFTRDLFWQAIPAWRDVSENTFCDSIWQEQNAIHNSFTLKKIVGDLVSRDFIEDVEAGLLRAPMAVRLSPYLVGLINWSNPYDDPLRRQFLPVGSALEPDHPFVTLDPVNELGDSPTPGLTHRYHDRALFLVTDVCPVYCRFCTRSYAVGTDTPGVTKVSLGVNDNRWEAALRYITERVELEDIIVSGGDVYRLRPEHIQTIGNRLLNIDHVRRIRFATKGPAVQPMKILTDTAWTNALSSVVESGRKLRKEVSVHTHFNHPREITGITEDAMHLLFDRGVIVRNLSVIMRGVNDDVATHSKLVRCLTHLNIRPYYAYISDLVSGIEDLRTSVADTLMLEKWVRGSISGHNTPTFVLDAPGGGGKRDIHSYEHYDRETGISVYSAPSVKPGALFMYGDPLRTLAPEIRQAWTDPVQRSEMIRVAIEAAGGMKRSATTNNTAECKHQPGVQNH